MTTAAAFVARAQAAAAVVARAPTAQKNDFLRAFARSLRAAAAAVARANRADMAAAKDLPPPLVERLSLARDGIEKTALGIEAVAALADPIGEISHLRPLPSGIRVGKMRVPLGVILLIYESRPAVTADAAALIVKAGNAAILRGGKESARTNRALAAPLARALAAAGLPESAAQIVTDPARALVGDLLRSDGIDLIVPRGGRELITRVAAEARAPVLKHLDGNCHIFVDADCDIDSARRIVVNAKTRRYGVCNALESLLVHKKSARRALASHRRRSRRARSRNPRLREIEKNHRRRSLPRGERGRLGGGISRARRQRQNRRFARGGDRAYQPLRLRPHRRDFDRKPRGGGALFARSRFRLGYRQRLDRIRRRLRIRIGRGDRNLDRQTARARAGRTRRADLRKIYRARRGRNPRLIRR